MMPPSDPELRQKFGIDENFSQRQMLFASISIICGVIHLAAAVLVIALLPYWFWTLVYGALVAVTTFLTMFAFVTLHVPDFTERTKARQSHAADSSLH